MPRHDLRLTLRHMRDHAAEAVELTRGRSRKELDQNRLLSLGLTRLVEIVGEAAVRTAVDERQKFPALPWAEIIGMRNRLIHGYDQVDLEVLWKVVSIDLPPLVAERDRILGGETGR